MLLKRRCNRGWRLSGQPIARFRFDYYKWRAGDALVTCGANAAVRPAGPARRDHYLVCGFGNDGTKRDPDRIAMGPSTEIVRIVALSTVPSYRRTLGVGSRRPDRAAIGALNRERTAEHHLGPVAAERTRLQYSDDVIHFSRSPLGRCRQSNLGGLPTCVQTRPFKRCRVLKPEMAKQACWHHMIGN